MFHDSQAVLALSREENPTVFQKTLGAQRLLLRRRRLRVPARQHPDGRQVAGADVPRREAATRRGSRRSGRSSGSRGTRSTSGSRRRTCRGPRTASRVDRDGQRQAELHADQRRAEEAAATTSSKSMLGELDMNPGHLIHRFAYMKNDIPVAGCAHQAGTVPLRHRPGDVGAEHGLPRARGRQPLRRRHELLPEHQRGEPGADGDGERAARRRPPARAAGREGRRWRRRTTATWRGSLIAPSGEQIEIAFGDSAPWSSRWAAGCARTPAARRELLDGYGATRCARRGAARCSIPWPNRIEDGSYEFGGRRHQLALNEPERGNAIHGLVRWAAWTVGERDAEPRRDAARAASAARLSVRARPRDRVRAVGTQGSRCGRPRRTPARSRAPTARARTRT